MQERSQERFRVLAVLRRTFVYFLISLIIPCSVFFKNPKPLHHSQSTPPSSPLSHPPPPISRNRCNLPQSPLLIHQFVSPMFQTLVYSHSPKHLQRLDVPILFSSLKIPSSPSLNSTSPHQILLLKLCPVLLLGFPSAGTLRTISSTLSISIISTSPMRYTETRRSEERGLRGVWMSRRQGPSRGEGERLVGNVGFLLGENVWVGDGRRVVAW